MYFGINGAPFASRPALREGNANRGFFPLGKHQYLHRCIAVNHIEETVRMLDDPDRLTSPTLIRRSFLHVAKCDLAGIGLFTCEKLSIATLVLRTDDLL